MKDMYVNLLFSDMVFKIDDVEEYVFKKIFVCYKVEFVIFCVDEDLDLNVISGKCFLLKEFYEYLQCDDVIVIDGCNDYEYEIGYFCGVICLDVEFFCEFLEWIWENLGDMKDKKIIIYCIGGICCEKLIGFMIKEGFQDVVQLEGGIVIYGKDFEV